MLDADQIRTADKPSSPVSSEGKPSDEWLGLAKFQVIMESLPYRIMVIDLDYTINTVNQLFLDTYGIKEGEAKGRKCYEACYGLDRPCAELGRPCFLLDICKEKKIISKIVEKTIEDGSIRYDVMTCAPILDDRGEVVQMLETSRDVTDRIILEREVQQSNTFLQNVFRSTVDGIVVVDTKGKVLLFNEGMENLTGYSASEIMNQGHLSSFYDMETARENMRKMRSGQYGPPGKLNPTAMTIETINGEKIPVTLSASIVTIDGKEVGSVGVFTDMRQVYEMKKELDEAHLQLVQSEKIASVGRMAAGVAHEINNPLSVIMMSAEFLQRRLENDPELSPDVQDILEQTWRCKEIVSNLLEFSRKSVGRAAWFSIAGLLDRCLNLLTRLASFHNIAVTRNIDLDMLDMVGDEGQLEQVFTNLFTNAADAMEGHGSLTVAAGYDPDRDMFIVKVTDTGPGIKDENRSKIFDIFFTTKGVGRGTGLGLSISKNIVQLHGGSIWFECPPEGGTVFTVELPREALGQPDAAPVFVDSDEV